MIEDLKFFRDKKILVTGHTGFIGSWLIKVLSVLGADLCGFSLPPPTIPNMFDLIKDRLSLRNVIGDIRDSRLLKQTIDDFQPEIVIHLAAQPIVLESFENPLETFQINVTGTVNLLNELRSSNSVVKSIIVFTSDKSYHNNEWVYPYREIDPLGGKDPYSASKSCQDIVVNSFRESYFQDLGIGISAVRAGNVIGGGDWAKYRIIPDTVRAFSNNQPVMLRNPNAVRPWQHVMEPISGILMLAEKMYWNIKFSDAWNFGPDTSSSKTVKEVVETFIKLYGSGNYETEESIVGNESSYLQIDSSKARKMLKWSPHYDFEQAVNATVEWYKKYLEKDNMDELTERQIREFIEE